MFDRLQSFFKGESSMQESVRQSLGTGTPGAMTDSDLHIAAVVLLIEMAGADKAIAPAEAETVCGLLAEHLAVPVEEIPTLIQTAIAAKKEKGKIDEFVEYITANFDNKQRQLILAMIWKVVIADGKVDKFEERFALQIKNRFRLSDLEAAEARRQAELGEI